MFIAPDLGTWLDSDRFKQSARNSQLLFKIEKDNRDTRYFEVPAYNAIREIMRLHNNSFSYIKVLTDNWGGVKVANIRKFVPRIRN